MVLTINEVIQLKSQLAETFGAQLHFHDACGAQSFSLDAPATGALQSWITEQIKKMGGTVHFSPSGKEFTVQ